MLLTLTISWTFEHRPPVNTFLQTALSMCPLLQLCYKSGSINRDQLEQDGGKNPPIPPLGTQPASVEMATT